MTDDKGPFGVNFAEMLKQAEGLKQRLADVQERLGRVHVEGEAGGGMVRVVANGRQEIEHVEIEHTLFRPEDKAMVQDLLVVAINAALQKAKGTAAAEVSALTGGLGL